MFNSVTGVISYKDNDKVHLLNFGIEWEIHSTQKSIALLPEPGKEAKIFTFLYHREDQLKLYGFSDTVERGLFLDLIKVESIGPRLALRILSGISTENMILAIETEDFESLSNIPGLGQKTAQKII